MTTIRQSPRGSRVLPLVAGVYGAVAAHGHLAHASGDQGLAVASIADWRFREAAAQDVVLGTAFWATILLAGAIRGVRLDEDEARIVWRFSWGSLRRWLATIPGFLAGGLAFLLLEFTARLLRLIA